MKTIYKLYTSVMARKCFYRVNTAVFRASLHGLGVMNIEEKYSGERYLLEHILKLEENAILFDVGANIGEFSLQLIENFSSPRIYAFEPQPDNYQKLKSIGGISSFDIALGDKNEEIDLFDDENAEGTTFASIHSDVFSDLHGISSQITRVQCRTIDSFCSEHEIDQIDFLKVDTEGNELRILKGASELIKNNRIKNILFEFNEMNTVSGVHMRDFRKLLSNYDLFRLLPQGLLPLPHQSLEAEIYGYQNIFAVEK